MGTWSRFDCKLVLDVSEYKRESHELERYNPTYFDRVMNKIIRAINKSYDKFNEMNRIVYDSNVYVTGITQNTPVYTTSEDLGDQTHIVFDQTRKIVYISGYNRYVEPVEIVQWFEDLIRDVLYRKYNVTVDANDSSLIVYADAYNYSYVYVNRIWDMVIDETNKTLMDQLDYKMLKTTVKCPIVDYSD